jgi:hypothetical protein
MLVSSVDSASNISTIQPRQHTPPQMTEVANCWASAPLNSQANCGAVRR